MSMPKTKRQKLAEGRKKKAAARKRKRRTTFKNMSRLV